MKIASVLSTCTAIWSLTEIFILLKSQTKFFLQSQIALLTLPLSLKRLHFFVPRSPRKVTPNWKKHTISHGSFLSLFDLIFNPRLLMSNTYLITQCISKTLLGLLHPSFRTVLWPYLQYLAVNALEYITAH